MSLVSFPNLLPDYQDGANAGNFAAGIANAAADFVCGLYADFPAAVVSDTSPNSFGRGLMDSVCDGRRKPPPPTPKPEGGQCSCVPYRVYYRFYSNDTAGERTFSDITGAIMGFREEPNPAIPGSRFQYLRYQVCDGDVPIGVQEYYVGLKFDDGSGEWKIDGIERLDNLPDNCGGSGHNFDPNLPRVIPTPRLRDNITVNYRDGTSITLPFAFIPVGIVNNINPQIQVDVGGVKVNFDFSGAKIDFGSKNDNPDIPRNSSNDYSDDFARIERQFKDLQRKFDDQNDRFTDFKDDLDSIKKDSEDAAKDRNNTPDPSKDPDLEKEPEEPPKSSDSKTVEKLQWVCVELTQLPNRVQWGDGAPNVYYGGWLEFKVGQCNLPRQPIHFKDSMFKAPAGATGFAYTLTNGAKGKVSVYKTKGAVT